MLLVGGACWGEREWVGGWVVEVGWGKGEVRGRGEERDYLD